MQTVSDQLQQAFDDLLFGVRRSVRYHVRRRRFLESINRFGTFLALVFASAAVANLHHGQGALATTLAIVVTLVSGINLVYGTAEKARIHSDLQRKFIELEKSMCATPEPTGDSLREWTCDRLTIEADEPPKKYILDLVCHNELMISMGYPSEQLKPIGRLKKSFAQVFDIGYESICTKAPAA